MKSIIVGRANNALVDDEDYPLVKKYRWWISSDGYAITYKYTKKKYSGTIRMHRLIMNTPKSLVTDHINRNKLDNRRTNLRAVSTSMNMLNCNPRSTNKTGVVGVSFDKGRNRWRAAITINGKQRNRYFKDFSDAVKMREEYEYSWLR